MNIICFSDVAWNFLWQRQHQLIANLPPSWKIIFIEPSLPRSLALKIINGYSRIKEPPLNNKNIRVVSMPLIPLIDRWKRFRKLNEVIFICSMKFITAIKRIEDPVFLFYNPRFASTVTKLEHSLDVYDIIDDRKQFEAVPNWTENYHNYLINNSNLVIVSSTSLLHKITAKREKDVFIVGNGVDMHYFYPQPDLKIISPPIELQKIETPILGYLGAMGEWFDFDLLERILSSRKEISIVLIGWVFNNRRHLLKKMVSQHKNLYFLGRKSYITLPDYLQFFSAGIIPFKINDLTISVNPIKALEYLAVGVPVISTAIPELLNYDKGVYTANNPDEFIELIDKVLASEHDRKQLSEMASLNDWKHKSDQFVKLLERYRAYREKPT